MDWFALIALPALPFMFLFLKIKEKTVGTRHGDELGFFLLSIPCGFILWILVIYEIIKHVRIV